ncbi:EpsG family protein [Salmonella enterica]|nr:EpsG family protein [Salmonella enterica subsp. arizonae serovar 63:z4,z32:-]EAV6588805.1 EpsG family protein [Salmonella enterica subsp. arizonae serovar 63:z4,z23:-]ELM3343110.1 EpsG family protein [Salmonella enterica]HCM1876497.1 EpsG family protein [Salmonella enterica subsp. arizonae serovar 63:z4,z23:-]
MGKILMINKNQYKGYYLILSFFLTLIFALRFFYFSHYEILLVSDTLEYYNNFSDIENDLFPYGLEILMPILMFFIKAIGGNFYDFLFFVLTLWLPLIFIIIYRSCYNPLFFIIVFYFLTSFFYMNAVLIIRQYISGVFFIYCMLFAYQHKKISLFLAFLSILSHSYAIVWLIVVGRWFRNFITNKIILSVIIPISLFAVSFSFSSYQLQSVSSFLLQYNMPGLLQRKIQYYNNNNDPVESVSNISLILVDIIFILSIINLLKQKNEFVLKLSSLLIFNSFCFIMLGSNIVSASRFGFWSYYFSIPSLVILLYYCLNLVKDK